VSDDAFVASVRASGIDVLESTAELARVETDFGAMLRGSARGIVSPRSSHEVSRVVALARGEGAALTVRGGGLSQSGQSLPDSSFVLELAALGGVEVDAQRRLVAVGPAASFREIVARASRDGLGLPVLPLNLDLTVGGVLSAGGLGSASHRHGLVVDHVESLEVVLGTGELVHVGPERGRDIYDAVLGGLGRAGVLTRAVLRLVPTPPRLRTLVLVQASVADALREQRRLLELPDVLQLDAVSAPAVLGLGLGPSGERAPIRRFVHALHVTLAADVDHARVLGAYAHDVVHEETDDASAHAARFDLRFRVMRATGAWGQAHPWFEAFVPSERVEEALALVMQLPHFLAELVRFGPLAADASGRRPAAVILPDGPTHVIALLPSGVPPPFVDAAREALTRLDRDVGALGGKRYLSGWLPGVLGGGLAAHEGARHTMLEEVRARCDPGRVFTSQLTHRGLPRRAAQ
jgi:cytokinin dehydrogenase